MTSSISPSKVGLKISTSLSCLHEWAFKIFLEILGILLGQAHLFQQQIPRQEVPSSFGYSCLRPIKEHTQPNSDAVELPIELGKERAQHRQGPLSKSTHGGRTLAWKHTLLILIEKWENWSGSIERSPYPENTIEILPLRKISSKECNVTWI